MKASFEQIDPEFGSSFSFKRFTQELEAAAPFWHFHPEYEIVYISHGRGKRHIANHISYFEDGDLIFLGPNLPHLSFTEELSESHTEIVVQMRSDFLGKDFWEVPEVSGIRQLFERARTGISFYGDTKRWVGERLNDMVELDGLDRLLALLEIMKGLAATSEYYPLNVDGFSLPVDALNYERIQQVYNYVNAGFQKEITLGEAAEKANMTVPAFCRFFKRLTGKTFTQFVNEVRISHATRLLSTGTQNIAEISFESGFNNLSHFNKHFKAVTGVSPKDFRAQVRKVVE
ncbi:MAG: helix-turn-helix domain-containing protein [Haliscomenobacter sp.]|nr:helix-turn-helix domain-containing protein [Haliscomenobacter sp.]